MIASDTGDRSGLVCESAGAGGRSALIRSIIEARGKRILAVSLTVFGLVAVTAMVVSYALEACSHWYVLAFAVACAAASTYAILIRSWPFAVVEGIWCVIAVQRWHRVRGRPTSEV